MPRISSLSSPCTGSAVADSTTCRIRSRTCRRPATRPSARARPSSPTVGQPPRYALHHPQRVGSDDAIGLHVAQQLDQVFAGGGFARQGGPIGPATNGVACRQGRSLGSAPSWRLSSSDIVAVLWPWAGMRGGHHGRESSEVGWRAVNHRGHAGWLDGSGRPSPARISRVPAAPCSQPRAGPRVPAEQVQGAVHGQVGVMGGERLAAPWPRGRIHGAQTPGRPAMAGVRPRASGGSAGSWSTLVA